jgi:hypothetical protein
MSLTYPSKSRTVRPLVGIGGPHTRSFTFFAQKNCWGSEFLTRSDHMFCNVVALLLGFLHYLKPLIDAN